MPSTTGPPRRHHHHQNFPPQHYTDLRSTDITLLAPLFAPKPPSLTITAHETLIRKKISSFPSHLRTKLPILSPFCSVHKSLNAAPIVSILSTIQNEVSPAALLHWAPVEEKCWLDKRTIALLEEMNCIWMSPSTFQGGYGRGPSSDITRWNFVKDQKCAACKILEVGNNVPGIAALGACTIARIEPRNWRRSNRVKFLEEWIGVAVERSELGEGVVKVMWECGVRLRNAMGSSSGGEIGGERREGGRGKRREYIDEFVAQTQQGGGTTLPMRPARSESQESHVEDAERFLGGGEKEYEGPAERDESDAVSIKTIRQRFPPRTPPQQQQPPPPKLNLPPASTGEEEKKLATRYIPSMEFFTRIQQSFHENDSRTLLQPPPLFTPSAPRRPRTSVVGGYRPTSSVYSQPTDAGGGGGGNRVASSIYSRAVDEEEDEDEDERDEHGRRWDSHEDWFRSSILEEGEFIDSYQDRTSKGLSEDAEKREKGFI